MNFGNNPKFQVSFPIRFPKVIFRQQTVISDKDCVCGVYVCVCRYICVWVCVGVCMGVCVCSGIYVCGCVCGVCMCVGVCMGVCVSVSSIYVWCMWGVCV